jgi:uncharacterized protein (DUF924 family)
VTAPSIAPPSLPPEDRARVEALLEFWFGRPGEPEFDRPREVWFERNEAFDAALRERFLDDQRRAALGELGQWLATPDGALALILLLDQLPRNLHRGSPAAYATDAAAREAAARAIARGHDVALPPVRRRFVYLPFTHSEDLADQRRCCALMRTVADAEGGEESVWFAERHREIIERFGRFPHRNRVLGRAATPAEERFLEEPHSSF